MIPCIHILLLPNLWHIGKKYSRNRTGQQWTMVYSLSLSACKICNWMNTVFVFHFTPAWMRTYNINWSTALDVQLPTSEILFPIILQSKWRTADNMVCVCVLVRHVPVGVFVCATEFPFPKYQPSWTNAIHMLWLHLHHHWQRILFLPLALFFNPSNTFLSHFFHCCPSDAIRFFSAHVCVCVYACKHQAQPANIIPTSPIQIWMHANDLYDM